MLTKNEIFDLATIMNSLRAVFRYFSRFQNGFQSERVWDNPGYDRWFTNGRGARRG